MKGRTTIIQETVLNLNRPNLPLRLSCVASLSSIPKKQGNYQNSNSTSRKWSKMHQRQNLFNVANLLV